MKNEGSLTGPEYALIHSILNEYCVLIVKNKINEPSYVAEVRKTKLKRLLKLIDKMDKRMEEQTDFCH